MRYFILTVGLLLLATFSFLGKRGDNFERPPWQVFPDMDDQEKYLPQRTSSFFADGRTDRPVPEGSVHRGNEIELKEVFSSEFSAQRFSDDPQSIALHTGLDVDGNPYVGFPIEASDEHFALGQAKYDMYCAVCHGLAGDGNGATKAFGLGNAASFHDPNRAVAPIGKPEGGIFKAITEGVSAGATGMVSFADRLTPTERWAVILHMRALQKTRVAAADVAQLPKTVQAKIQNISSTKPSAPATDK